MMNRAQRRRGNAQSPEEMQFYKVGDVPPPSLSTVLLPNGKEVPVSEFTPPPELVGDELETWYENREDELMFGDDDE